LLTIAPLAREIVGSSTVLSLSDTVFLGRPGVARFGRTCLFIDSLMLSLSDTIVLVCSVTDSWISILLELAALCSVIVVNVFLGRPGDFLARLGVDRDCGGLRDVMRVEVLWEGDVGGVLAGESN